MTEQPPTIEIESAPNPGFAVILMHGLGADANDFVSLVPELRFTDSPAVRFVFPNAPEIAVTANNGYVMRAWYDIRSFQTINQQVDDAGIKSSCATVRQLIEAQNRRGIPTSNIFLAGFSQGAAMTYSAGLTHPEALAGLSVGQVMYRRQALLTAALARRTVARRSLLRMAYTTTCCRSS
jgi:phospholipase/carboxylesterase